MSKLSIQKLIGKGYNNGWFTNCHCRYRVFEGARATKKSVVICGYEPLIKIITDPNCNIIIARKDDTNNSSSTYPNLVSLINNNGLSSFFRCKISPYEIIYKPTGQKIIFKGCNNPSAIASTKFEVGELTDVYFEEASELTSYEDFRQIDGSVRSQNARLQITLLMNGWDKKSWIYEVFWKGRLEDDYNYLETHDYMDYTDKDFNLGFGKGLYLHKSTFRINEFRAPYKDESMKILKEKAFEIYKVEGLGMWGNNSEATYQYFNDKLILPHYELMRLPYIAYTIGIDIGSGNGEGKIIKNTKDKPNRYRSAMTMSLTGFTGNYDKIISLQEYFYSSENKTIKKGSPEIAEDMIKTIISWIDLYKQHPVLMKGLIIVYVESADPGGFRTLLEATAQRLSLFNIKFITATKNRIQSRVDFINLMMAFGDYMISDTCQNLIREIKNARAGEDGSPREDCDDHEINANEYSWIPLLPKIKRYKDFKEH